MPEAPEITIDANFVSETLSSTIKDVIVVDKYHNSPMHTAAKAVAVFLPGHKVVVGKKGKVLWLYGNNQVVLFNHGLSGCWDESASEPKYAVIGFKTDHTTVWFSDQMRYGNIRVMSVEQANAYLDSLGPDILPPSPRPGSDVALDSDYFGTAQQSVCDKYADMRKRSGKKHIAVLLMNQALVSGVGNYIKSEALYRAKIDPRSIISKITPEQLMVIYTEAEAVAQLSLQQDGRSDYKMPDGYAGDYDFSIYKKAKTPKGNPVLSVKHSDGRKSYYAPAEQILLN